MIESVAVFGDSWSVCAYEKIANPQDSTPLTQFVPGVNLTGNEKQSKVTFESLFKQHNIVATNFSVGGYSNHSIVQALNKRQQHITQCDAVLICQTDPFRDLCVNKSYIVDEHQASTVPECNNINDLAENLLQDFYSTLSTIQNKIDVPIVIFTGCSKICNKQQYNNLRFITPCWTRMVDTALQSDSYFDSWNRALSVTDYLVNKFPHHAYDLKQSYCEAEREIVSRSFVWQTNHNFGWVHAGPGGYLKMFDQIMQKLGEIHD